MPNFLNRNPFPLVTEVLFYLAITGAYTTQGSVGAGLDAVVENSEGVPSKGDAQAESEPVKRPIVHPEVPRIAAGKVKEMLAKKADFVIVDTNPADFFESWHIPTAVNIPYIVLMDNPNKRVSMLATLPEDKLIVLYCLCEEGADSSEVALMLRRMGYRRDRVTVLEGGLIQWDAREYPMVKK